MASNKTFRFGPVALTTVLTTNVLNPAASTGGVNAGAAAQYVVLNHIRMVNKTAGAVTASLWIGATGGNVAGSEFAFQGTTIAANSYVDWYGKVRLDATDFLVGGSNTTTALSIEGEGEVGVAG